MYVETVDKGECFSTTMEFINGVYANKIEWAKYGFCPKNGLVGEVVKRTPSAYIVKKGEGIYVPMTRKGIKEITYEEYLAGQTNNVCNGLDERQKRINNLVDDFNAQTGYDWQHLPDMRMYFKQDVIQNITKLTCDFKRNIFLPDLEKSAVIYAVDMCLEYRHKSGRNLAPITIKDISNQVCDVYMELFNGQFLQSSKDKCFQLISDMVMKPNAQEIINEYYQQVDIRYNWS
ncbi:hypothetical protein JHU38_12175 [Prevotella sp. A2931]|uniref:Uncharacterized protein n=1 Tax=Prevotella illustrans TaxID=2800387 RepID=A0ABS3M8Q9_9BACT|nr:MULTISPECIES: hypothetical protein [Prevotella]MBO1364506.1 hypothetical protein [Prevotella illustrans]PTL26629.1 hypothetical protein C3V39_05970 [Prevotella sp. oral taxon 820]